MTKGKFIYTTIIKDYKRGSVDIEFSVYGIFDTNKVHWTYHVISHIPDAKSFRLPATIRLLI